ncbi:RNA polymerase sigma-70 factor, ECF subfamily [Mariniphaga anaerophila]|uniref:RNA polymerase sigma-70 factor, ECF subfamily n=1 Tax=Mariniphaga anaerophila TaxID=1484053 RepID=A0A1M5CLA4_9BACT|nr:RNA polymerase sigma-70 factor [Mariniphaga anaerophila]SHF55534.1 RNA polymerase sigma-70 factor, ECF subfamily [Mariniphaga anaerophila]
MIDAHKRVKEEFAWSHKQFADFFRENYHTACLVALRYMSDVDEAEDMVQDIFAALWEKRKTIQVKTNHKNYLFTAVRNHAINTVQRSKEKTISLSALFVDVSEEENPNHFKDEELAAEISKAINELPKGCRAVFTLAYLENMTYQQIADKLNLSKNTIKTQMGVAYRQLREKLKKYVVVLLEFVFN